MKIKEPEVPQPIVIFADRHPLLGPLFWAASIQYIITMIMVGLAWKAPHTYSVAQNTISDLGNTVCGVFHGRFVCSPLHSWMNASFIVLGITMIAGSVLICPEFRSCRRSVWGFMAMALSGVGASMVGIFAENTIASLHEIGALLPFVVGNVGLVVLGLTLDIPFRFRIFTIVVGVLSLIATGLFLVGVYAGLGIGGMERVAVLPQTIWLIIFGIYMSSNHVRQLRKRLARS